MFLDHDNVLPTDYVRKLVRRAASEHLRFAFTKACLIDRNGKDLHRNLFDIPDDYRSVTRILLRNYIDTNTIFIHSVLLRMIMQKLAILSNEFYDGVHEDWLIAMLALKQGEVEYLSDIEMNYRVHESNRAYSVLIGTSRRLHLTNLWRDFKNLTAFGHLEDKNLTFLERFYLLFAVVEKLVLFFVLKWFIPDRIFGSAYKVFASGVQLIERRG